MRQFDENRNWHERSFSFSSLDELFRLIVSLFLLLTSLAHYKCARPPEWTRATDTNTDLENKAIHIECERRQLQLEISIFNLDFNKKKSQKFCHTIAASDGTREREGEKNEQQ